MSGCQVAAAVKLTQGDLMLCSDCDNFRFGKSSANKTKSTKQTVSQQQQQLLKQPDPPVPESVLSFNPALGLDSGATADIGTDVGTDVTKVIVVVNELLATQPTTVHLQLRQHCCVCAQLSILH